MDKKTNEISFRTSINGFNKRDVINYISSENRRFAEKKEELEDKVSAAEEKAANYAVKMNETRNSLLLLVEKKDAELESLNEKIISIQKSETAALEEAMRMRDILSECEEQIKEYGKKLSAIESAHAENEAETLRERQRADAILSENNELKVKYSSLNAEHNDTLSEMSRLRESSEKSKEIAELIMEIHEKYGDLDKKLRAQREKSDSFLKNTHALSSDSE